MRAAPRRPPEPLRYRAARIGVDLLLGGALLLGLFRLTQPVDRAMTVPPASFRAHRPELRPAPPLRAAAVPLRTRLVRAYAGAAPVETLPEPIGGLEAMGRGLAYPEAASRAGVSGAVLVSFTVDEQGRVRDPFVLRGIGYGCDEEAMAAVRRARFYPARAHGRPVPVRMLLPVTFKR